MAHRVFVVAAIVSAVLTGLSFVLFIVGLVDPWPVHLGDRHLSVARDCYVTIRWGHIVFFNNTDAPDAFTLVYMTGSQGNPIVERTGFDSIVGVSYRYYHFLDSDETVWNLAISMIYPTVIFAALPAIWVYRRRRQLHRARREPNTQDEHGQ
jgi:hypothetical protein